MRIAVLTGGGDVPGLNPCIKAITESALSEGWEVLGFRRGWAGPLCYNPDDPEGWRKLIRAYSVLQETDKAKAALAKAREALNGDAAAKRALDTLAKELGLES